ncbi:MAG: hypothetical protein KIH69_013350 [Anaerolineae bacterium]|nr:hypothetical protein [Anaerolineae bacterium]
MRLKTFDRLDRVMLLIVISLGAAVWALSAWSAQPSGLQKHKQRLVYLAPAFGTSDLYLSDPNTANKPAERLTNEPFGVYDFAVNITGHLIAYSADNDAKAQSRDLWVLNLDTRQRYRVASCQNALCNTPTWRADDALLAFEYRQTSAGAPTQVWLADVGARKMYPLRGQGDTAKPVLGVFPKWSPNASTLAYFDNAQEQILVAQVDGITGAVTGTDIIENVQNPLFTWSPDGAKIAYIQHQVDDALNRQTLMQADLTKGTVEPLGEFLDRQLAQPAWSNAPPLRVAVAMRARALPDGETPSQAGQHIWLVSAGHAATSAITQKHNTNGEPLSYGGLRWSGDDAWIAVVRNLAPFLGEPEVWVMRTDGSEQKRVAQNATLPEWVR